MRDIRGELQERASLFEEQINAHEAETERLIEQLKREHHFRLEDLKAELEAVNRLMEIELRWFSAPAAPTVQTPEAVHHAVHQPAQQSAPQPPQHSAHQSPQHPVHQPPQLRRISRCSIVRTGRSLSRKSNPSSLLPTSWSAS